MSRHISFKALACFVLLAGTVGTLAFHSTGPEQPAAPSADELPPPAQDTIDYLASIDPRTLLPRVPGTENVQYDNEGQPLPPLPPDIRCRLGKWARASLWSDCGPVVRVAGSANSKWAALAADDGLVRVFDVATNRQVCQLNYEQGLRVFTVAFTPDNRVFVAGINPLRGVHVAFKDLATGEESHTCVGETSVRAAAVSPDLTLLALGDSERNLEVRDLVRGTTRYSSREDTSISALAFSPDGSSLVVRNDRGVLRVVTWATGHKGNEWYGPSLRRGQLQFMPDGKQVLYQDQEGMRVWDLAAGKALLVSLPNQNPNRDVALSADGRTLATLTENNSVCLWEVRTGLQRRVLSAPSARGFGVTLAFTPDGRSLIGGNVHGNGVVWSLDSPTKKAGADELDAKWELLNNPTSGEVADDAIRALAATPKVVPYLLRQALVPRPGELGAKEIEKCLADLDAPQFDVREKATEVLARQGGRIKSILEKAQAATKSGEVHRRLEGLLEGLRLEIDDLRLHRVVEVLESIATDEAREALNELAQHAPGHLVRADAESSAERVARRRLNDKP